MWMMKTKKILFTDLDGTLLNSQKQISRETRETLAAFLSAGNLLVLTSGRDVNSINEIKEKRLKLNLPGIYLIGYNGGQIYDCDNKKTIYRNGLKIKQAIHIIETALEMGHHSHTYNETHIIAPVKTKNSKEFAYYKQDVFTPVIYTNDFAADVLVEPGKCLAINLKDNKKLVSLMDKIHGTYDDVTCIFSCPLYLEIIPTTSGKGAALIKLCEILNIPTANSIAAGDQENDLSMLEAAGLSIAMANGVDSLKAIADIVTEYDNNHDGLALCLQTLCR